MKKTALILALALVLTLLPHTALAATSGKCGDNLRWSYSSSTKTLTLTGSGAMYDCSRYTLPWRGNTINNLILPDGLTYIGTDAFYGLPLQSLIIPDSVTEIGVYAFGSNGNMRELTLSKNLTRIPMCCFDSCQSLVSVVIPGNIKYIDEHAFYGCRFIQSLELPEGLLSIGYESFGACYALKTINIPSTLKTIGSRAFSNTIIEEITLPEGLEAIGAEAFRSTKISTVTIPASVTTIGGNPFALCSMLEEIQVAEGCTCCQLVDGVLYNASGERLIWCPPSLEETTFSVPSTVKTIETGAFYNASKLTHLDIPEGVTKIGNSVFLNATSLTRLTVPASVTEIGTSLFGNTMDVSNITVQLYAGSAMETYLNNNPSVANSYVNRGIQIEYLSRRDHAVFVLPEDLLEIGEAAFEHIDAASVNIPDGAASIGDRAFADCPGLAWIWIPESVTDISATAFAGDDLTIYGVAGSAAETFAQGAGIPFVAEG